MIKYGYTLIPPITSSFVLLKFQKAYRRPSLEHPETVTL